MCNEMNKQTKKKARCGGPATSETENQAVI